MAQGSTLENIFSYSVPANNLFQISLVKDCDPNLPNYKKKYFFFLTLAPGENGQNGRTFNFQNKITLKQEVHKVLGLAHAFKLATRGNNFSHSLFVDSSKSSYGGGQKKQLFVNAFVNEKRNNILQVSVAFRLNENAPVGLLLDIPDAIAIGDIIESMAKKSLEYEMNDLQSVSYGGGQKSGGYQAQSQGGGGYQGQSQGGGGGYQAQPQGGGYQAQGQGGGYQGQGGGYQAQPQGGAPQSGADVTNSFADGLNAANGGGGMPDDDIPF